MQTQPIYSSKTVLERILPADENGKVTPEVIREMDKQMEEKMEEFDSSQRQKTAQSIEDFSNLVITA